MQWHQVSANRQQLHCMLVEKVLPAINMKWLVRWRQKTVLCQQDNASSHLLSYNTKCLAACKEKKLSIQLSYQPVQLPDLNVKNLGLFFLIDCLQKRILAKNLGELINAVHKAYNNLPVRTIDNLPHTKKQ